MTGSGDVARIDLNADLGELADGGELDRAMLAVVTSTSIAAGGHAGGGEILRRTVGAAVAAGVSIGAHPSYPDRAGFGRTSMADRVDGTVVARFVADQVRAVAEACDEAGVSMRHVKAHGALYGDLAAIDWLAEAFLDGMVAGARRGPLAVLGPGDSVLERTCAAHGIPFVTEGFADRAYRADGSLVPRSRPGALLEDPGEVARQAVRIAMGRPVRTADGEPLVVRAQSVCLHGDTPGSVGLARAVRDALTAAGVQLAPPGAS